MSQPQHHRLRLSIDLRSIKDHDFLAQLYVKYNSLPDLNIRQFRSSPALQITNQKVELPIPNAFATYIFDSSQQTIKNKLNNTLQIELWHNDRLKKDIMLGKAKVQFIDLLGQAIRKTKESYVRVYDAYLPVDQYNQIGDQPVKKVAALRVIVYLEDLGPLSKLAQNQQKLGLSPQVIDEPPRNLLPPGMPSQNINSINLLPEVDRQRQVELNELQYKVVWELETWKKAEQAKTKILLKQREVEFWNGLAEQQKKLDLEKQKHFRKIQANLALIEGKLKSKAGELKKREEKMILLQQQLQAKITEVSRQLLGKDQELEALRKKSKEDKANMAKEKASLQLEIQRLKNEISKMKIDFEEANKEDEKSPLFMIKTELNNKIYEIRDLTKQLEKALETKDQYKAYYEKMRQEVVRLKAENEKKQESIDSMKYENEALKNNIKMLQQQMAMMQQQQQAQYYYAGARQGEYRSQKEEREGGSKLDVLRRERQELLDGGAYGPNDPLIREYDKMIADLMGAY